jgi:hypothetical protein
MALKASRALALVGRVLTWSVRSREIANFTYDTTRESKLMLAGVVAQISGRPMSEIVGYVDELEADGELAAHVCAVGAAPDSVWNMDPGFRPGRRLAFYLVARAAKPRRIVEAGVDKGLGAVLLCRALTLNARDGQPGDYLGIEFDGAKPIPLYDRYPHNLGRIVRGDSLSLLRANDQPIDLFIHDTTADEAHMRDQLAAVMPRMAAGGVVASTWTTRVLIDHAMTHRLKLLTHREEPVDHWFQGDRVAFLHGYPGEDDASRKDIEGSKGVAGTEFSV